MTRSNSVFTLHRASERVSAAAASIALTFLTLLSVDVRAGEHDNPPSITVKYSELALADTKNAAVVYRKLRIAASKVCGLDRGSETLQVHIKRRECYQETLANAVRKIDRPALTAVHETKNRNLG